MQYLFILIISDTNQPYIQEITTTIAPILPIIVPTVPTTTNASDASTSRPKEAKSRALEFDPNDQGNNLSNKTMDLSNVSLDDDDENDETPMISAKILSVKPTLRVQNHTTTGQCEKGGLTYDNGEKLEVDCDLVCTCENGTMDCVDRCSGPYIRKGTLLTTNYCCEKEVFRERENVKTELKTYIEGRKERLKDAEERLKERSRVMLSDIKETKQKVKGKVEEIIERENIYTVPNLLCVGRILITPYLGMLIIQSDFDLALGVLGFAALTDLVSV